VLGVAAIPVGVVLSWRLARVELLQATEVAVPVAFAFGLPAISLVRRARFRLDGSVARHGERMIRIARLFARAALFIAATGAIALGFYGLLVLRG
jgi:hypothetical protein